MTAVRAAAAALAGAWGIRQLLGRQRCRKAATRTLPAAHLAVPGVTPLFVACCPTWPATGGRAHHRTCHITTEETGR